MTSEPVAQASKPVSPWRRWLWLPLLVIFLYATVAGLRGGQARDVANWFNQICAACIGLTH